jgi:hypothetical protein
VQSTSVKQPLYYLIRVLTAKPVREAFLRRISFAGSPSTHTAESTVHVQDIKKELAAEAEQARLTRFIESNPDDILIRESDDYVVIALTTAVLNPHHRMEIAGKRAAKWWEQYRSPKLTNLSLPSLSGVTSLSTKTGKRVKLVQFELPGADNLGAKFYFPRRLPDGSLFVTPADKELRFETEIDGKKVKAKFNLDKLVSMGKLEI